MTIRQEFIEWLEEQQDYLIRPLVSGNSTLGSLWCIKRLSATDTGAKSHQSGPLIPKEVLRRGLPSIYLPDDPDPRSEIELLVDSARSPVNANIIWYNNRLRDGGTDEVRITGVAGSPLLDARHTGSLTVFAFQIGTDLPRCHVWICANEQEAQLVEELVGFQVVHGKPRIWPDELGPGQIDEISELVAIASRVRSEDAPGVKRMVIRRMDAARNRAVEHRAMAAADHHFRRSGWCTKDVSLSKIGYDIRCRKGSKELHVEVKGVSGDGSTVNLTRNEVDHARKCNNIPVLYVLSEVDVEYRCGGTPIASGGNERVYCPWDVDQDGNLEAMNYSYRMEI